ncbi:MAG: hypothetical protein ACKVPX_10245 [Myxococcaceae bacterium]
MRTQTRWGVLSLAVGMLSSALAWADAPTVKVKVEVVHASNANDVVEPPMLASMKKKFAQSGIHYSGYRRLSEETVLVRSTPPHVVALPNGKKASLVLDKVEGATASVRVALPPLETVYELGREGSVFLQAGAHQGGVLILVLSPAAL